MKPVYAVNFAINHLRKAWHCLDKELSNQEMYWPKDAQGTIEEINSAINDLTMAKHLLQKYLMGRD